MEESEGSGRKDNPKGRENVKSRSLKGMHYGFYTV